MVDRKEVLDGGKTPGAVSTIEEILGPPIRDGLGALGRYMAEFSPAFAENDRLREKLAKAFGQLARTSVLREELAMWDGAFAAKKLDPKTIVRNKWASRHKDSYADDMFKQLKADIKSTDGNVQPIKVRPLAGESGRFEIVFGQRRHQACLELGLPVLAMIVEVNDRELFIEMIRENRCRSDNHFPPKARSPASKN